MGAFDTMKKFIPFSNYFEKDETNQDTKSSLPAKGKNIISPETPQRVRQTLETWRNAIQQFDQIESHDRQELITLYNDVSKDPHTKSVMRNRRSATVQKDWGLYNEKGERELEREEELKTEWFNMVVEESINSVFYGYSLLQISGFKLQTKELDLKLIRREHVKPEWSMVVEHPYNTNGLIYKSPKIDKSVIYAGKDHDAGLLYSVGLPYILKTEALKNWGQFNETYGQPVRVLHTNTRDEESMKLAEQGMKSMSKNSWGIIDEHDVLEFISASTSSAETFDLAKNSMNDEISKLIVGQTMTTENGSSRSQAEVHERVANDIVESDQRLVETVVNKQLLPKLTAMGWSFEGLEFKYVEADELNILEKAQRDKIISEIGVNAGFVLTPEYIQETYGVPVIPTVEKKSEEISNKYKGMQ